MSRSIRFQPDPLDHALIDFQNSEKTFSPTDVGIILNESYTGCAIVVRTQAVLRSGQVIQIQVGRLGVLPAKIVWVKELETNLLKIGLQFLE